MVLAHNQLLRDFCSAIYEEEAALFVGAGLSLEAGFVNWKELLRDLAVEIGLNVDQERDLVAVAQYHLNQHGFDRSRLNQVIKRAFDSTGEIPLNHQIICRLPINTIWTTNYDTLLEDAYKQARQVADVKSRDADLAIPKPNRKAVIYKMHGDIARPDEVIICKDDYEQYEKRYPLFQKRLTSDLLSKTFLFLGFSFTDPHLEYILGHLRALLGGNKRPHFAVLRNVQRSHFPNGNKGQKEFEYEWNKQELLIEDLRRYSIHTTLVENYQEVTDILLGIERRCQQRNIFVSGSADEFGSFGKPQMHDLCQRLGTRLMVEGYKLITGFGMNIGDAIIMGALAELLENNPTAIDKRLSLKPLPKNVSNRNELTLQYREEMITKCGIIIFIAGNSGGYKEARGVLEEFEIARAHGKIIIPIGATGFAAQHIWRTVMEDFNEFYAISDVIKHLQIIGDEKQPTKKIIDAVFAIIKTVRK